jgi:hypothetical protein
MHPAKSLRKLRSATTAYLEDGGALIHSIDTLLRDVQQTLEALDAREQSLVLREEMLCEREIKLETLSNRVDKTLQKILGSDSETNSNCLVGSVLPSTDSLQAIQSPSSHPLDLPLEPPVEPNDADYPSENTLAIDSKPIAHTVTQASSPAKSRNRHRRRPAR